MNWRRRQIQELRDAREALASTLARTVGDIADVGRGFEEAIRTAREEAITTREGWEASVAEARETLVAERIRAEAAAQRAEGAQTRLEGAQVRLEEREARLAEFVTQVLEDLRAGAAEATRVQTQGAKSAVSIIATEAEHARGILEATVTQGKTWSTQAVAAVRDATDAGCRILERTAAEQAQALGRDRSESVAEMRLAAEAVAHGAAEIIHATREARKAAPAPVVMPIVPQEWDRQPGESAAAYEAFVMYRDMELPRSGERVAEMLARSGRGCAEMTLNDWRAKNRWVERAAAWDAHVDAERQRARLEQEQSVAELLAEAQKAGIREALRKMPLTAPIKLDTLVASVAKGSKAEEDKGGYATSGRQLRAVND